MRLWEQSLEIDPSDPAALNNLAATLLTHPQLERRDLARAVALAERGVEVTQGRDPDLLRTLAAAFSAAGREADARAILDRLGASSGGR